MTLPNSKGLGNIREYMEYFLSISVSESELMLERGVRLKYYVGGKKK